MSPQKRKNGFCSCHLQVEPGIHNFQYFRSSGGYVDFFKKCGGPIEDRINFFYGDCIILIIHLHTINMIALSLQKKKENCQRKLYVLFSCNVASFIVTRIIKENMLSFIFFKLVM